MPHHKPLPSREELLEHLRYDPETGLFWWVKRGRKRTLSKPVGSKSYYGTTYQAKCIDIRLNGRLEKAHRLAWRIMTGDDPGGLSVDHINRNPFDNRWQNLRLANQSLQIQNQNKRSGCASKYKGVSFCFLRNKWYARATFNGKSKHLGYFLAEDDAAAVAAPYYIH